MLMENLTCAEINYKVIKSRAKKQLKLVSKTPNNESELSETDIKDLFLHTIQRLEILKRRMNNTNKHIKVI